MLGQLTLLWVLWFINSISFSSLAPIPNPPTGVSNGYRNGMICEYLCENANRRMMVVAV